MLATDEQAEAIKAFQSGDSLKINAFAGTGKTTTLELLSKQSSRRGVYLAFNKSIASEARQRFSSHVACSTVHSLAYRATPSVYKTGDKMTGKFNANAIAQQYGLRDWVVDRYRVTARSQAHLALKSLHHFMHSDREAVELEHVPILGRMKMMQSEHVSTLREATQRRAQKLWNMMCDPNHHLPLGHDGYLKLWALGKPRLAADYILLDEAQDTNPAVLGVLERQSSQLIYVGDRHQQIYAWRGAINAMERIATPHQTYLTTSFRFGPEIADAATGVLRHLGEPLALRGNPEKRSYLAAQNCRAILARTNASVMAAVIQKMAMGHSVFVMGGVQELVRLLEGVSHLKNGLPSDLPEFFGFSDWKEVVAHSMTDEGQDLRTLVSLVEQHGEARLITALNATANSEDSASLVVSTAHKAKGREWDTVELLEDFLKSRAEDDSDQSKPIDREEMRLFYVALTRAKVAVQVSRRMLDLFQITATEALPSAVAMPSGRVPEPIKLARDRSAALPFQPNRATPGRLSTRRSDDDAGEAITHSSILGRYGWPLLVLAALIIGMML